ncbi:dTDP-glucose 4,6-dehydratase [Thalassospira sp. ER-Se-21-Dark]|uniref:dTDP-glucose 4,6-dehydratase n=1 Tax=Thalassospira sp. ER-Se-21-Dark TaxID=2585190 RepID=UPI001B3087B9|nr:dTDP-glucose 4,6-dehydratase [Thalassospira sp. ER-Se-21-Dark]MBP3127439.1 dTDP-glucose 4,6-dehydratase [Thalassospira sp. ER-Se-21-Dark]
MKVIVTGGAGFIGSAVCRLMTGLKGYEVLNIDKLTYAGDLRTLASISERDNYHFAHQDICNRDAIIKLFDEFQPDAVMHLAAESHVDRSIDGPADFIQTNVVGTFTLLDVARAYFDKLPADKRSKFRFHHISTDEVYGSLGSEGLFTEETAYAPTSPYSASKASSDHLVQAWHHTYGLPIVISNCSNNYGPYQFPEKLIPLMALNLLHGKKLPVYGEGLNTRDWLHVEDHAEALVKILTEGRIGEKYNVGGCNELTNIDVVKRIFNTVQEIVPDISFESFDEAVTYVKDRPGHDWRYAIDPTKMQNELGWKPKYDFETGLRQTIEWYVNNREWWEPILKNKYAGERLGSAKGQADA